MAVRHRAQSVLDQLPDNPKLEESESPRVAVAPKGVEVHRPGDKCETMIGSRKCTGFLSVTSTFENEDGGRLRYLQCRTCGLPKPQYKQMIPSRFNARRRRKD